MDFLQVTNTLLQGFGYTCLLFLLTLVFALPLGLAIAFGMMSKFKPLSGFFKVIVWIIRGVPLMLQLFMVYYLPGLLNNGVNFWSNVDKFFFFDLGLGISFGGAFLAAIISFTINYACYFAVIYKGGIEGISKGQHEAGQVLGLSKRHIFRRIILFQVIKRITPPMSNEIITLVKDTALSNVIGVIEIIKVSQNFANGAPPIFWPIFYSGVFYLIFVGLLTLLFGYIEKKMSFYKE